MTLLEVYRTLLRHYGPQHWWPGDTSFEIMVGAVLTQNTAWSNVEKAIANLRDHDCLDAERIIELTPAALAALIRPAGYFNLKAKRLQNFCRWYIEAGGETGLAQWDDHRLRRELLAVNGVGPETADDIVLYACERPVLVIDAYTRRIFSRLGLVDGDENYEALRHFFEQGLKRGSRHERVRLFNEYHALIVRHAKEACRTRPHCAGCCLRQNCPAAE